MARKLVPIPINDKYKSKKKTELPTFKVYNYNFSNSFTSCAIIYNT